MLRYAQGLGNVQEIITPGGVYELVWMFFLASVIGFVLEGLWHVLHTGRWENHSGMIWGPLCTVYGLGAVVMYLLDLWVPARDGPVWAVAAAQFVLCCAAGATVEYATSLFQEVHFHSYSWDYSAHRFQLFGRVTLSMTLLWGLAGTAYLRLVCPGMLLMIRCIHGPAGLAATWLLMAFLLTDAVMSAATVKRWQARTLGEPARTGVEAWLDRHYPDERMRFSYANMRFSAETHADARRLDPLRRG